MTRHPHAMSRPAPTWRAWTQDILGAACLIAIFSVLLFAGVGFGA
jgi:hypothetical protein